MFLQKWPFHDFILRSWYANKMFPHYFHEPPLEPLWLVKDWLVAAGTQSNTNAWFSLATTVGICRRAPKSARKYKFDTTSHVRNHIERQFNAASQRSRKSRNVQRVSLAWSWVGAGLLCTRMKRIIFVHMREHAKKNCSCLLLFSYCLALTVVVSPCFLLPTTDNVGGKRTRSVTEFVSS